MRSFALFVLLVAASALVASALDATGCDPDVPTPCGTRADAKSCCPNLDKSPTLTAPFRCYNLMRSDDHCGIAPAGCGVKCEDPFPRCVDGVCGTKSLELKRIRRFCNGQVFTPIPGGFITSPTTPVGSFKVTKAAGQLIAHILLTGATSGVYRVRLIQLGGTPAEECHDGYTYCAFPGGKGSCTVSEAQTGTSAFLYLERVNDLDNDQISSQVFPTVPPA